MRTGFTAARLSGSEDGSRGLSWFDDIPEGNRAVIERLRELLTVSSDPIDRHFQFALLEGRLYRSRDLYVSALDEWTRGSERLLLGCASNLGY